MVFPSLSPSRTSSGLPFSTLSKFISFKFLVANHRKITLKCYVFTWNCCKRKKWIHILCLSFTINNSSKTMQKYWIMEYLLKMKVFWLQNLELGPTWLFLFHLWCLLKKSNPKPILWNLDAHFLIPTKEEWINLLNNNSVMLAINNFSELILVPL